MLKMNVLLLAAGRSSRMNGQDKALLEFRHKPMIEHVLDCLPPHYDRLIINCHSHHHRYRSYSSDLLADNLYPGVGEFSGPLVGILSALDEYTCNSLLVMPCDTPNLTAVLIARLISAHHLTEKPVSCLSVKGRLQPLHCVVDASVRNSLFDFLSEGNRKASDWLSSLEINQVDCAAQQQQLANINCPEDWLAATSLLPADH